jgi:PKD domain
MAKEKLMKRLAPGLFVVFALSRLLVAAPVVRVISGSPLSVHVGDDASFQIFDSDVPGAGQIYPSSCTDTADMGVFAYTSAGLVGPDFAQHCGTATTSFFPTYAAWTPVSISPVSGTGTAADPFTVVVVDDSPTASLRLTLTVTLVNGDNFFRANMLFSSTSGATFDAFLGADIYLANSDSGVPLRIASSGAVGGTTCAGQANFNILLVPVTSADAWTATNFASVWTQIGAGDLNGTVDSTCEDDGAALEWRQRALSAGQSLSIDVASSFGTIPPIAGCNGAPGAPVNVEIHPTANPSNPVTATDYLTYHWDPPASGPAQDGYHYWINGDSPQTTTNNVVEFVDPLGLRSDAPITLHVVAFACNPELDSPQADSPTYSLAAPGAAFSASPTTVTFGTPVVFTDTSSPQATSWLWFFADGEISTEQNPSRSFAAAGVYSVVLVASNGSGTSVSAPGVIVVNNVATPAAKPAILSPEAVRSRTWAVDGVRLEGRGRHFATIHAVTPTVAYLRIEADGRLRTERRLVLPEGATTIDLGAYRGWNHREPVDLRIVADRPLAVSFDEVDQ